MKDYLLDIVKHTHSLGFISLVKVTGTDKTTSFEGLAEDRSVILQATTKTPVADFMGTFGMPNLDKLGVILRIPEYAEDAKISLNKQDRNGESVPVGIAFENAGGDFKNDYRFMASEIINEKLKTVKMRDVNWGIEFQPTIASIQRFKFMISANSEETTFIAKTEDGNLKFYFGDHSTHAGNFVFQHDVTGEATRGWAWPVEQVSKILSLGGDTTFKFSDDGVAEIVVDSGLAEYRYLLPAQSK
jgi:hypothetical protein|tara:strand:- start:200 stop:931 length:732 start_codon:yes stop_codon:yes gene_type:complete